MLFRRKILLQLALTSEYLLVEENENGCLDTIDGITIEIIDDPSNEDFENGQEGATNQVITINGDGINDGFRIPESYMRPYYELIIMNRYGDAVYSKSNYPDKDFKGFSSSGKNYPTELITIN